MSIDRNDRPGLLLACHGDFPEDFLSVPQHMALYQRCISAMENVRSRACYGPAPTVDEFTGLGEHVAAHLLSRLKPNHMEMAYLGTRPPDIRQAVYRTASRGAGRIVCVGAAGLMVPGHGASFNIPGELMNVIRDNPALDLVLARTGMEEGDIATLARRSLEHAFKGPGYAGRTQWHSILGMEDTGVVLICSHGYGTVANSPDAMKELSGASAMMSDMSKAAYMNGGKSETARLMRSAASLLKGRGFHAVEVGFIDFALPDIKTAARRLIDAGSTHIVATGMPSLLHRHPYSVTGPSEAIEQLQKSLPDANIVYVKPDPAPIAEAVAEILASRVQDAENTGISLKRMLRDELRP